MIGFAQVLANGTPVPSGLTVDIPETWLQGRTAYGGFSSALALAVAMQVGGEGLPPLRSAQLAMIAPLYGTVTASAQVLRRGRNATWIETRIAGENGTGFVGNFVFMGPMPSSLAFDDRPLPDGLVSLEQAQPLPTENAASFVRNNFEARVALPPESSRREVCWWARLRDRARLHPMVELMLSADATPPGVMPQFDRTLQVSSMHWQMNLLSPAPMTRDGWWLLHAVGDYARDGCSSQHMALWNTQGEPLATGTQSIALFG